MSHGHSHGGEACHGHGSHEQLPPYPSTDSLLGLFPETLVQKDGLGLRTVAAASALADAEFVLVYLSAHWCPPCKGFTPKLSAFVRAHAQRLGIKVVFASSDHSEKEFASYFGEHAWDLAFPFGSVAISQLGEHFNVGGIPTLLVLDKGGHLVTSDGREGVEMHPDGADFPWRPPTLSEVLASMDDGGLLVARSGAPVPKGHLAKQDYLALYFSASWCAPCQRFTPELASWYEARASQFTQEGKRFDIVFVSSDKDEASTQDKCTPGEPPAQQHTNHRSPFVL